MKCFAKYWFKRMLHSSSKTLQCDRNLKRQARSLDSYLVQLVRNDRFRMINFIWLNYLLLWRLSKSPLLKQYCFSQPNVCDFMRSSLSKRKVKYIERHPQDQHSREERKTANLNCKATYRIAGLRVSEQLYLQISVYPAMFDF